MKIAISAEGDRLCAHFGHAPEFHFFEADRAAGTIGEATVRTAPPHEPGALPRWLADQGAGLVITGGMGQRARQILEHHGIEVILGAPEEAPAILARAWVEGRLSDGTNSCDHGSDGQHHEHHHGGGDQHGHGGHHHGDGRGGRCSHS